MSWFRAVPAALFLLTFPQQIRAQCALPAAERVTQREGVPFQATEVIERTLSSGVWSTRGRMARNSAGSTFVEVVDPRSGTPAEVVILDVPHRRRVNLDPDRKEYSIVALPELQARPLPLDWELTELRRADQERDRSWHESAAGKDAVFRRLGKDRVSGLEVVGWIEEKRPPSSVATGSAPAQEVCEIWLSVDLGIPIRVMARHPAAGEETDVHLTEILRVEPDPMLFRIPEGYHLANGRHRRRARLLPADDGM